MALAAIVPAAAALLGGCGGDAARDGGARSAGHERMLELLRGIDARSPDENVFVGDLAVRAAEREIAAAPQTARWQTRQELGTAQVRLGREREGIAVLEQALALVEGGTLAGGADAALSLHFHLGVAWLRLGETENCCASHDAESCILPLRGNALHARPEGSRTAMAHLRAVLAATPPDDYWSHACRWLLSLAAMTLGEHPEGVEERWRLPAQAFESAVDFPEFRERGQELGLDVDGLSGGLVADDFDGDGRVDVMASDWNTRGQLRLLRQTPEGIFEDRTEAAGLSGLLGGLNLVSADYDNDGDLDVLVLRGAWLLEQGRHPNSLLNNRGDGTFEDVTFAAGLGEEHWPTQTAAFADYDRDGDLDLYVGNESSSKLRCRNQLFENLGDGRFVDVTLRAGVGTGGYCKAVAWGDVDGDGYPDLYVSNIDAHNRLYRNRGDGTFVDVAATSGVGEPIASFPCWFFDYDNDGNLDLFVAGYQSGIGHLAARALGQDLPFERMRLYRGDGRFGFVDVAEQLGLSMPAMPMGSGFGDVDGDGLLDIYLGTGDPQIYSLMPNLLLVQREGLGFADVSMASRMGHLQKGHAVAFCDFDLDGDIDVLQGLGGAYLGDRYRNAAFVNPGFGHRRLVLRLVGSKSARSALHARVRVEVEDEGGRVRSVFRTVTTGGSFGCGPLQQTIGLGAARSVRCVEVDWPCSVPQRFEGLQLDAAYRLTEGRDVAEPLELPRGR